MKRIRSTAFFSMVCLLVMCIWVTGPASALTIQGPTIPGKIVTPKLPSTGVTVSVAAPSSLTAESPEVGRVVLQWNDNSSNETGFAIERRLPNDSEYFQVERVSANVTTYEESELSTWPVHPGEKYYYRVRAYRDSTYSSYSNEAYVDIIAHETTPSPPAALRAKGMLVDGRLTVRLFWGDTSSNETKFVVQRKKGGGSFVVAGEVPANSVKFEEPADLERNVTYTYRVIAYNSGGAGVSNEAQVLLPASLPVAPVFNWPETKGSTMIQLTWTDNSNNEDGFIITRYGDKAYNPFWGTRDADKEYILDPNTTSLLVDGLTPYREYSFEIVAHNALGKTNPNTAAGMTGPHPPHSLTASTLSPNQVKLSWAQDYSVQGFTVERKKAGGSYAEIATISDGVTSGQISYTDPLLLPGTQYFYRIRSWIPNNNQYGARYYSDYSNEFGITTQGQNTSNIIGGSPGLPKVPGVIASRKVIALTLGQKEYLVNGVSQQMDTEPIIHEDRTMLPVRYLTEPLGATLDWDGAAQKVTVVLNDKTIELFIGQNKARVNGQEVMIDPANPAVAPITVPPGRTMLPLRFISENLGCSVEWDAATNTASLSYGG